MIKQPKIYFEFVINDILCYKLYNNIRKIYFGFVINYILCAKLYNNIRKICLFSNGYEKYSLFILVIKKLLERIFLYVRPQSIFKKIILKSPKNLLFSAISGISG